jgi:hypothetical protein
LDSLRHQAQEFLPGTEVLDIEESKHLGGLDCNNNVLAICEKCSSSIQATADGWHRR